MPGSGDRHHHDHNVRAILGVRGFRRLLAVRLVSQVADGWFQAALAGSVLFNPDRRASAIEIAIGFAVLLLPYSLVGPYVGVFLDRWSRRSIIFVANVARALLVAPTAVLIWSGNESPLLVALAFVIIGLNRFVLAGLSAATPHVVADRRLVTANALATTVGSVCYSLALGSAVLLLKIAVPATVHGYAGIAALAPLGYLASALLARASFTPDELGPDADGRHRGALAAALIEVGVGMVAGIGHLASRRGAAWAMLAQAAHRVLYGVLAMASLLLYREYFNSGADVTGSLDGLAGAFVAASVGMLAGAFLTPPISRRIGGWRWVAGLLGTAPVVVLAFGLPFTERMLMAAVCFMNLASQSLKIVVDTSLQHECADEFRGRVFSINDTAFNACLVVGLYVAAHTLPPNGRSPAALVMISIGYALVAVWYAVVGGRWARRAGDDIALPEPAPPAKISALGR